MRLVDGPFEEDGKVVDDGVAATKRSRISETFSFRSEKSGILSNNLRRGQRVAYCSIEEIPGSLCEKCSRGKGEKGSWALPADLLHELRAHSQHIPFKQFQMSTHNID